MAIRGVPVITVVLPVLSAAICEGVRTGGLAENKLPVVVPEVGLARVTAPVYVSILPKYTPVLGSITGTEVGV